MIMKFTVLLLAAAVLAVNGNPISKNAEMEETLREDLLNELNILLEEQELENELRDLLNEKAEEADERFLFFPPAKQKKECIPGENCINGDCFQGRTRSVCVCDNGWSGGRCDVEGKSGQAKVC